VEKVSDVTAVPDNLARHPTVPDAAVPDVAVRDAAAREAATRDFMVDLAGASRREPWAQRQEPSRQREWLVRQQAARLCDELGPAGFSAPRIARQIGVPPRTLRDWRRRLQQDELDPRLRGRPPKQSGFRDRHEVLEVYHEVGPHVGLPTLRAAFPTMPRGELIDLQATFRRHYRATHRRSTETLHWTTPGRVWAMDYAQPPSPIDGCYGRVLAVRDLASGMQLAWLPVLDETAETTAAVLQMLFAWHGAPLVLKSDNGSPFISRLLYELLSAWEVASLFSPPQMPGYNGSCEAGIGVLEVRTNFLAAVVGHPLLNPSGNSLLWTSADLEAARQQANEFHRPWGHRGPTRSELWTARSPITVDERAAFSLTLARCHEQVRDALAGPLARGNAQDAASLAHGNSSQPACSADRDVGHRATLAHGSSPTVDAAVGQDQTNRTYASPGPLPWCGAPGGAVHGASDQALIHRRAVRQALVGQGLLSITRRSIHLPLKRLKTAKIS
jgi:putative transposase